MFTPQVVKPPTSNDVALAAGVSRATVSFVLNDKPNARISDDTRHRVLEAAHRLSYRPNVTAQSLASSSVSGLLVAPPRTDLGSALARTLELVIAAAVDDGSAVLRDGDTYSSGADAAMSWTRIRPESVLASADRCDASATSVLRLAGVRALLVYGDAPVDYAPSLVLAQEAYGALAAEHLVRLGHGVLCYLLPAAQELDSLSAARFRGADAVARAAGARLKAVRASATSTSLRDWAHGWRYDVQAPTAVIAYDDRHAAAAVRALTDAGVHVPADVSVIGAGDDPIASEYCPRLSSVTFSPALLAASIGDAFTAMTAGERVELVPTPAMHLYERESTAPAPAV
ncbi:LacI family DNA-binding transcriptional regulator [Rathayibacter soli]|uniref:LacI family DNA-binding transcriptional regulator n=1 Tax=Rathayibacter soli TaxID=3144168 RepID=UPI0027E5743A|nr:LacI family DNA-binding transcriptional regulator [Glaciibacter superstes]